VAECGNSAESVCAYPRFFLWHFVFGFTTDSGGLSLRLNLRPWAVSDYDEVKDRASLTLPKVYDALG